MNQSISNVPHTRSIFVFFMCLLALGGCGHKNDGGSPISYSLSGTITGLNGSIVLENNGSNDLTISSSGSFAFPTQTISSNFYSQVANSGTYSITIISQPAGQACTVSNGSGTVSSGSNISNVTVTCSTNYYNVSGTASIASGSVVLQNNNGDNITVTASGTFTFPTQLTDGSAYDVTVLTPPNGEICSVSSGVGNISGGDVSTVMVVCSTNGYTVGGTVSGLTGGTVVLQDNNGDNLSVNSSSPSFPSFTFATSIADTSPYVVSLYSPPSGQNCAITNGSGTLAGANVTNVLVTCKNVIIAGCIQTAALSSLTGAVTTYAGSGSTGSTNTTPPTLATAASFNYPRGITYDGTNLYIADTLNNQIRMITLLTGAVSTFAGSGAAGSADNTGTAATFDNPYGITTDGTNLYVADTLSNKIRKIVISTGVVTTLAGSGATGSADNTVGTSATFYQPHGITNDGSNLYVADTLNNKIRKIVISTGAVSTLAGSGTAGFTDNPTGTSATFNQPWGLTTDGTNIYVADTNNHLIRKIVISTGTVTTLAGIALSPGSTNNPNLGTQAQFDAPRGITTDGTNLYVADSTNHLIRKIVISSGTVSTVAGTGTSGSADLTGTSASFYNPSGITTDGVSLYVADTSNSKIRKIN